MNALNTLQRIARPGSLRTAGTIPVLAGFAVLALVGCNGDNDIIEPDTGFDMDVEPDSVTVAPGGTATIDVEIERLGGFDGLVDLTVENLPDGVSSEDTTIASAVTSGTVTLEADEDAAEATATAQVRGSGTGVDDEVETLVVTVGEVDEQLSLSVDPDTITLAQGESGEVELTVTRQDWDGAVTLSVPTNLEDYVSFDPETVEAGDTTSTITIDVPADQSVGEQDVTVTGAPDDPDVNDAEVTFVVDVVEGT